MSTTTGNTNSVYLTEIPTSLTGGATFQPPPPPPQVQLAEPQLAPPVVELDSSSVEPSPVAGVGGGSDSVTRKPGRPKRNAPEAEDTTAATMGSAAATDSLPPPPTTSSTKRRRGRPRGSVTKNRSAPIPVTKPMPIKTPGVTDACDLRLHKILLSPGEDLSAKLMTFAQHGNRNFYIASHYGSVSQATLREPTLTGSRTFEGLYQVISFSGSLIQSEAPDGKKAWTGGLTVTMSGSDNSITVGAVAGPVIAATNMQVIVCSFVLPNEEKETEPATVNTVNTPKTNGLATGADGAGTSNVDNSGKLWHVSDPGDGDGVWTSTPDNFGTWTDVNDPDTGNMMQ